MLTAPAAGSRTERARVCRGPSKETLARRIDYLTAYQNAAYAMRYRDWVEAREGPPRPPRRRANVPWRRAVARNLFKLMAYKDEYEVARLYSNGEFLRQVAEEFDGNDLRFAFHLAPPLLARARSPHRAAAQDHLWGRGS